MSDDEEETNASRDKNIEYIRTHGPSTREELPHRTISPTVRQAGVWGFTISSKNPGVGHPVGEPTHVYYIRDEHDPKTVLNKWVAANPNFFESLTRSGWTRNINNSEPSWEAAAREVWNEQRDIDTEETMSDNENSDADDEWAEFKGKSRSRYISAKTPSVTVSTHATVTFNESALDRYWTPDNPEAEPAGVRYFIHESGTMIAFEFLTEKDHPNDYALTDGRQSSFKSVLTAVELLPPEDTLFIEIEETDDGRPYIPLTPVKNHQPTNEERDD